MTEELAVYPVRIPKELVEKLPKAKLIAGKTIQDIFKDALEEKFEKLKIV